MYDPPFFYMSVHNLVQLVKERCKTTLEGLDMNIWESLTWLGHIGGERARRAAKEQLWMAYLP